MLSISEIFVSLEGEGIEMGLRKVFLRLAGCNLKCSYCDTDYREKFTLSAVKAAKKIRALAERENICHLSITGGEPLLQAEVLNEIIPELRRRFQISLETNGTLACAMKSLEPVDFVSCDIKIPSASGVPCWKETEEFIQVLRKRRIPFQLKAVVDKTSTRKEVIRAARLAGDVIILQPVFKKRYSEKEFSHFDSLCSAASAFVREARFLPQMHKYLGIR